MTGFGRRAWAILLFVILAAENEGRIDPATG
jgi:hypothetical protein